jgi:hypothetical protein
MKRSCHSRFVAFLCSAVWLAACVGTRAPTPAEWSSLEPAHAAREPLPDDAEAIASRLAAAALADRRRDAEAEAAALAREDAAREASGEKPSGLSDNAAELLAAFDGPERFAARADSLLHRGDLDPALRRRVEIARDSTPLAVANTRMNEELRFKLGSLFNRIAEPLSTMMLTGALNPITAARGAISTLLTVYQFQSASPREREALHEYDEWLARHPEAPGRPEVAAHADALRAKLAQERTHRDLRGAELAADRKDWQVVDLLADRALRQSPDDAEARGYSRRAKAELADVDRRARRSLSVDSLVPESLSPELEARYLALARTAAAAPPARVAAEARAFESAGAPAALAPELRLLESFEPLARGDEDATREALERVPRPWGAPDTASRQAGALLGDPFGNAWGRYLAAESADTRDRARWLALGRFANGFPRRDLWRPLEIALDVPSLATTIAVFPLRIIQYPNARTHFGAGVLVAGERYVASHPDGVHAEEVHAELESLYDLHGQPSAALRHAEARRSRDEKKIAAYRARVAEQLLAAADKQDRVDLRLAYLATVLRDFPDTPSAKPARAKFIAERADASPQHIRLTHDFLVEHPALWGPGALGLAPELLDGKGSNGEIAERGVTLLGKSVIKIELEDGEPIETRLSNENFTRFVALLDEQSREKLATDDREKAVPDAARDAFFGASRLGLADSADARVGARSEAVYESTHEKYGFVRARESILPVDLVLQGDLSTLGLSAFPRIRLPEPSPDALLYE